MTHARPRLVEPASFPARPQAARDPTVEDYLSVRRRSEAVCRPLTVDDHQTQAFDDASPAKWHLGHTTWFFERFVLAPQERPAGPDYGFVFNSYYESMGPRWTRARRGQLSRPTLDAVYVYRAAVDAAMVALLGRGLNPAQAALVTLGLQHEQQHQELMVTDLKAALGMQPFAPAYDPEGRGVLQLALEHAPEPAPSQAWLDMPEGRVEIGHAGDGFAFDNESPRHGTLLHGGALRATLVTNAEFLAFIADGGYRRPELWHSEGWDWVRRQALSAPMYWRPASDAGGHWEHYTLQGVQPVDPAAPVTHVSWFEASASCAWAGLRLPTEAEREAMAPWLPDGRRWEWTGSAYLPYPGFRAAAGAVGEYNGKFMVNQQVLRGASFATPPGHARDTYRNFFPPTVQWQYTGIRPARDAT